MSEPDVVVVGAGPAGLAAAAELRRVGISTVVLEQADAIGPSWRGRYDRLRLNTSRWSSKLPGSRWERGTGMFPSRDQMVSYLEQYAARNELDVRLGISVEHIDREESDGWVLQTSAGEFRARQVVVATGYEHTPFIPDWPGRGRFRGELLHACEYRNPEPFRGQDVLVVGPGCSGMEIAYDLAVDDVSRVWLSARTPPNIVLREQGGLPGDLFAIRMLRLPPRIADAPMKVIRRLAIGDLTEYGLPRPEEGLFARLQRTGMAPAIVDKEVIQAIKNRRFEIVRGVESLDETGVVLADGKRIEPDAVIAATGYSRGLEPLVGHLGVLDGRGVPRAVRGEEAAPGLRFIGYVPRPGQIGYVGGEAKRAAKAIARSPRRSAEVAAA
jgi:cation diffusion facilitator CzcD-associated flavoprotein CzcO